MLIYGFLFFPSGFTSPWIAPLILPPTCIERGRENPPLSLIPALEGDGRARISSQLRLDICRGYLSPGRVPRNNEETQTGRSRHNWTSRRTRSGIRMKHGRFPQRHAFFSMLDHGKKGKTPIASRSEFRNRRARTQNEPLVYFSKYQSWGGREGASFLALGDKG